MDYNFDLDDDKYLFADDILSWIEDDHQRESKEEEADILSKKDLTLT